MIDLIPGTVPTIAGIGLGLGGLALGIAYGKHSARDTLAAARRLASAASTYWTRAENARALVLAVETPTQHLPLVELEAATRTRMERLRNLAAEAVERGREALKPTGTVPDWAPGEMTAAFARVADEEALADGEFTLPAQASPWTAPPMVHAPRGIQAPPRWEARPAPQPRPDTPSRARLRRSEAPGLTGRMRAWSGSLLGPVPTLPDLKLPEPFRMPAPRQRLPHDPRRMAMLAPDDTRQYRTRTAAAA